MRIQKLQFAIRGRIIWQNLYQQPAIEIRLQKYSCPVVFPAPPCLLQCRLLSYPRQACPEVQFRWSPLTSRMSGHNLSVAAVNPVDGLMLLQLVHCFRGAVLIKIRRTGAGRHFNGSHLLCDIVAIVQLPTLSMQSGPSCSIFRRRSELLRIISIPGCWR